MPLEQIVTSKHGVRTETFDRGLDELTASIGHHGQLHAVSLIENEDGTYVVANGHRRVEACRRAGVVTVRSIVYRVPASEEYRRELLIQQHRHAANTAQPLSDSEHARLFGRLMRDFDLDAAALAELFHGETPESVAALPNPAAGGTAV